MKCSRKGNEEFHYEGTLISTRSGKKKKKEEKRKEVEAQKQEVIILIIIISKAAVGQNDPKKTKQKTEKASRTLTLSTHIQSTRQHGVKYMAFVIFTVLSSRPIIYTGAASIKNTDMRNKRLLI